MKPPVKTLPAAQIQSITWNNLTWIDITYPTSRELSDLGKTYDFHPLAMEDGISRGQLSKVDDYGKYLCMVLHFPIHYQDQPAVKSVWLTTFIGPDYIITLHDDFKFLTDLFIVCQTQEKRQEFFSDRSGYLIYKILDYLIESCFPILKRFSDRLDEIEDRVFDESNNDTPQIAILRRDLITLRRIIWPIRSVFTDLKLRIKPFTEDNLDIYFDNLSDHVNKIWDNLEEAKEVIEVFKDSDYVLVTNRINRIVQTLTIVSSIMLPFLVVSSLYGMNVDLPGGLNTGHWLTFIILLCIMFIISGGMLYFFRRRHWI